MNIFKKLKRLCPKDPYKVSNRTIVKVCKRAIKFYEVYPEGFTGYSGLCTVLSSELEDILHIAVPWTHVEDYIPKFTYENAVKYANANPEYICYWWCKKDTYHRIKFLNWLISEYSK